jgi:Holliday junction resolvase RusA-like endonuclease
MSADGIANIDLFDHGRDPFSPVMLGVKAGEGGGSWSLTILGEAVPKGRPRLGIINGRARAFTPKKTRTYEAVVRDAASREWQRLPIANRPIWMRITFVRAIPQSWSIKKQNAAGAGQLHPTGRPDLDNGVKAITDAMNSIVYTDDALIVEIQARKAYGPMPHALIVVTW